MEIDEDIRNLFRMTSSFLFTIIEIKLQIIIVLHSNQKSRLNRNEMTQSVMLSTITSNKYDLGNNI